MDSAARLEFEGFSIDMNFLKASFLLAVERTDDGRDGAAWHDVGAGRGCADASASAGRQLAGLSRRLFRPAPQRAHADHAAEREESEPWPGPSRPNRPRRSKSSPLLVDGILYFTVPDNIWAVDARSGHQIWHYTYPTDKGEHIGHRGVAMYKELSLFPDSRCAPGFAQCKRRKRALGRDGRRCHKGYWTTHGAAGRGRPRAGWRLRRSSIT